MRGSLLLLLLPCIIHATELRPWFGRDLQPEWRTHYAFQAYERIDTATGTVDRSGRNNLLDTGLAIAGFDTYAAEFELRASETRKREFSFESGKLTGRLKLWNDIVGNPLSLVAGVSLTAPTNHALHDFNLLYHGLFECEAHLAIGKEFSWYNSWLTRWWGWLAVGIATQGDPWIRAKLAWEKNICEQQQLELFAETNIGLGDRALRLHRFDGYGGIQYRLLDLGVTYFYTTEWLGTFSASYCYRPYARNTLLHLQQALVGWFFEFAL